MRRLPTLAEIEKKAILERLVLLDYHIQRAADSLGMGKTTLYRRLKDWGLGPPQLQRNPPLADYQQWKLQVAGGARDSCAIRVPVPVQGREPTRTGNTVPTSPPP